jgi:tryptophan synthase alpha subunit
MSFDFNKEVFGPLLTGQKIEGFVLVDLTADERSAQRDFTRRLDAIGVEYVFIPTGQTEDQIVARLTESVRHNPPRPAIP